MIDAPDAGRSPSHHPPAPSLTLIAFWLLAAFLLIAGAVAALRFVGRVGIPVTVTVDGQTETLLTTREDVAALLADLGLTLRPEDRLIPAPQTPLSDGASVDIVRARPALLSVDGEFHSVFTQAENVEGLLAGAGVKVAAADEVMLDGQLVPPDTDLPPVERPASRTGYRRRHAWDVADPIPVHLSVRRAVPITVDDGSVPYEIYTTAPTIGEALAREQLSFYLGDDIRPGLGTRVSPGMRVYIERSKPVIVSADGRTVQTRTRGQTVGATLMELGLVVAGYDRVTPALHEKISPNVAIRVTRVSEVMLVEREPIPYESIMVGDDTLEIDHQRLAQAGEEGEFRRRWKVVYEDGNETVRTLLDEWVAAQPVTRKLAYGRKIVSRTLDTPEGPVSYWRKVRMYTTSYSPARAGTPISAPWYGRTRIGLALKKGMVAVDPKLIPLRSYVYVPGYGKAIAADTGGGVRGKLIDLGYEDHDYRSWHWWTDVYFLDPPPARSKMVWVLPNYPPPSFGGGRTGPR